ncbi:MAG: hypothetical protein R3315_06525 [Woeseiaceae bacterium]|nr:hypothetical protein [Woeseiaceae bacterium]
MNNSPADREDDMNCGLTMDERRRLRAQLAALPETMPRREVWQRIETQARAEGLLHRPIGGERTRWFAGAGIAAAVVLAVLNLPVGNQSATPGTAAVGDAPLPTVPDYDPTSDAALYESINALMVQSRLLERDLRRLPEQPQVARAGTLATIDDLQSRIAAIDYELSERQSDMSREQLEAYWRERVRLMDSLLRLRYAQSQRMAF